MEGYWLQFFYQFTRARNRINPTKITYWDGHNYGVITSKTKRKDITLNVQQEYDPVLHAKQVMDYYSILESSSSDPEEDFSIDHFTGDLSSGDIFQDTSREKTMDVMTLLSLPENLRKVGIAVLRSNGGTIDEISENLDMARSEVRNCLDHLTLMKLLTKKREKNQLVYVYRNNR